MQAQVPGMRRPAWQQESCMQGEGTPQGGRACCSMSFSACSRSSALLRLKYSAQRRARSAAETHMHARSERQQAAAAAELSERRACKAWEAHIGAAEERVQGVVDVPAQHRSLVGSP
jgi:hypothetical protein